MTQEFKFVDDVWTEQGGQRLTVALSENGEIVKFTLHCLEQRTKLFLNLEDTKRIASLERLLVHSAIAAKYERDYDNREQKKKEQP